jgi:hypothetical protein
MGLGRRFLGRALSGQASANARCFRATVLLLRDSVFKTANDQFGNFIMKCLLAELPHGKGA